MGKKLKNPPKIFNVNWFRLNENGKFMWPGFGDNFRVLEWILKRCDGTVDADETAIGYVPKAEDINLEGLDYTIEGDKKLDIDSPVSYTHLDVYKRQRLKRSLASKSQHLESTRFGE